MYRNLVPKTALHNRLNHVPIVLQHIHSFNQSQNGILRTEPQAQVPNNNGCSYPIVNGVPFMAPIQSQTVQVRQPTTLIIPIGLESTQRIGNSFAIAPLQLTQPLQVSNNEALHTRSDATQRLPIRRSPKLPITIGNTQAARYVSLDEATAAKVVTDAMSIDDVIVNVSAETSQSVALIGRNVKVPDGKKRRSNNYLPKLYIDDRGFTYKNPPEPTRASCDMNKKGKCSVQAHLKNGIWEVKGTHDCTKEDHIKVDKKVFQSVYKMSCKSAGAGKPRKVFEAVHERFYKDTVVPVICDKAMSKCSERARKKVNRQLLFPDKNFQTLAEFGKYIADNPNCLKYATTKDHPQEEAAISAFLVESSKKHVHLILYDRELLHKFTTNEVFIDGTFKSRPKVSGCAQLLTVLGRSNNKVVPFMWILTSNRTTKSYNAIWEAVKKLHPSFCPKTAMTDYERGLQNSLTQSFPGIDVIGCHFHFSQAVYKYAKKCKVAVKNNIQENEEGHKLLQRVINLALLPHEMIETELKDIERMVKEKIIDESKLACWDEFFEYFRSYWMSNVGPENFSVFDCYDRTNNFAESYHRHVINRKLGGRKSPKSFLGVIIDIKNKSKRDLLKAEEGYVELQSAAKKDLTKRVDAAIHNGWDKLRCKRSANATQFLHDIAWIKYAEFYKLMDQMDDVETSETGLIPIMDLTDEGEEEREEEEEHRQATEPQVTGDSVSAKPTRKRGRPKKADGQKSSTGKAVSASKKACEKPAKLAKKRKIVAPERYNG